MWLVARKQLQWAAEIQASLAGGCERFTLQRLYNVDMIRLDSITFPNRNRFWNESSLGWFLTKFCMLIKGGYKSQK